jgi:hypothetical protein
MSNTLEALRQNVEVTGNRILDALNSMYSPGITITGIMDGVTVKSQGAIDLSRPVPRMAFGIRSVERRLYREDSHAGFGSCAFKATLNHPRGEYQLSALAGLKRDIAAGFKAAGYRSVRSSFFLSGFTRVHENEQHKENYERLEVSIFFKFVADVPCRYRLEWLG